MGNVVGWRKVGQALSPANRLLEQADVGSSSANVRLFMMGNRLTPEDRRQIAELIEGLSNDMQAGLSGMRAGFAALRERLDRLDAHPERHGILLETGLSGITEKEN